jgi:hypothetical protein
MTIAGARFALKDAVHVQGAQFWLKLGEPFEALRELEQLPRRARRHPWAVSVFVVAFGAARGAE